jgi:hypothetical protein
MQPRCTSYTEGVVRVEEDAREVDEAVEGLAGLPEFRNARRLHWNDGLITQIDFSDVR